MAFVSIAVLSLLLSPISAFPTLFPRAVVAHDSITPFAQTVPATTVGQVYVAYKPYLKIFNGCVPFPAVDSAGNTGGGLNPSGNPEAGCSSSTGQVYVRGTSYNNAYAVMYSWYMPKDSPSSGLGHRHEWENAVVWLSSASTTATVLGLSVSAHGEYDTSTSPSLTGGKRSRVGYESYWPVNHQLIFTSEQGGEQPMIAWESLPSAARTALENTDFGDATVPFKESTFLGNLAKAVL